MGEKRFAKDPLLYIHQPTIGTPEAPMQHNYHTSKQAISTESLGSQSEGNNRRTRPLKRKDFFAEVESEKKDKEYQATNEKDDSNESNSNSFQAGDSKFKDMTLREKVAYFVNKPNEVKLRCEIKTEDKVYHGIITGEEDDHVFIRVGRRATSTKIAFDSIQDIRLLGF